MRSKLLLGSLSPRRPSGGPWIGIRERGRTAGAYVCVLGGVERLILPCIFIRNMRATGWMDVRFGGASAGVVVEKRSVGLMMCF